MLHPCEVFYVVIIWLVNKNWKKKWSYIHDNMKVKNLYIFVIWSANKRNKPNADSMPVHRLRCRAGTKSTLGQCVESTEQ